jgi:hypothetical protein
MKYAIAACLLISLSGCSVKFFGFKGSYPNTPIVIYSDRTKDQVWDNLIDFFAQNGIAIKIIDKASGLIVSEKMAIPWTYEDDKNKLKDPRAFVVIPDIYIPGSDKPALPTEVQASWNVRLKTEGARTSINVNLVNLDAKYLDKYTFYVSAAKQKYPPEQINGRTTGIFEKSLADIIK